MRTACFAMVCVIVAGCGASATGSAPPSLAPSSAVAPPTTTPSAPPRPSPVPDYSDLSGRLLVEHLGNALDLSESSESGYNPDRRRLYILDPADMTSKTAEEFLPGQPATGKSSADVSSNGKRVVFQDWSDQPRLYEANLDGTGFHELPVDCADCQLLYPDYSPDATQVVYVRIEGGQSWLEILDLASGQVASVATTRGPGTDSVPEQPAWSPDGTTIAFNRMTWAGGEPVVGTVHYGEHAPKSGVLSLLDVATGTVTDLPIDPKLIPGDANWSPDGATIVFAAGPFSTTGSVGADMPHANYIVRADGTGLRKLNDGVSPRFFPDGQHILFKDGQNVDGFSASRADGSDVRKLNRDGMDLTDRIQGFAYVGHWIPVP